MHVTSARDFCMISTSPSLPLRHVSFLSSQQVLDVTVLGPSWTRCLSNTQKYPLLEPATSNPDRPIFVISLYLIYERTCSKTFNSSATPFIFLVLLSAFSSCDHTFTHTDKFLVFPSCQGENFHFHFHFYFHILSFIHAYFILVLVRLFFLIFLNSFFFWRCSCQNQLYCLVDLFWVWDYWVFIWDYGYLI